MMKYALIGCGRIATDYIKAVVENNIDLITTCDIVPKNIENSKNALELVLFINKSSFSKKTVKLPLESCSTLDFKEKKWL